MATFSDLIVTGQTRIIGPILGNLIGSAEQVGGYKVVETSLANYNSISKDPKTIYLITS